MKKVVINTIGWFDINDLATIELYKRIYGDIYLYERIINQNKFVLIDEEKIYYDDCWDIDNISGELYISEIYLGKTFNAEKYEENENKIHFSSSLVDSIDRENKHLINLLEEWGSNKCSGWNSYLKIVSIPDDVSYYIENCGDGIEYIIDNFDNKIYK